MLHLEKLLASLKIPAAQRDGAPPSLQMWDLTEGSLQQLVLSGPSMG